MPSVMIIDSTVEVNHMHIIYKLFKNLSAPHIKNRKQTSTHFFHNMMTSSDGNILHVTGPFWGEIHWWMVDSSHKGLWRGALMFSLICTWINVRANNKKCRWYGMPLRSLWHHCDELKGWCSCIHYRCTYPYRICFHIKRKYNIISTPWLRYIPARVTKVFLNL